MSKQPRRGSGIDFGALDEPEAAPPALDPQRPRTGIGAISASLAMGRDIQVENERLKARVAEVEGRQFVVKLNPARIRASAWANRHEASFTSADFLSLKEEIASAGENTQAIKVRPVEGDPDHEYEIAFGHRRHRACLELALPVNAIVQALSDQQLFIEMERENRERKDLSPWEQGVHYKRALDEGLFPSARQLAIGTGAQQSLVVSALQLANLPAKVVAAFGNPLSLQYRYGSLLSAAITKDPDGVLERADRLVRSGAVFSPKHVLQELLQLTRSAELRPLKGPGGKTAGSLARDEKGSLTLKLKAGALTVEAERRLERFVDELLKG